MIGNDFLVAYPADGTDPTGIDGGDPADDGDCDTGEVSGGCGDDGDISNARKVAKDKLLDLIASANASARAGGRANFDAIDGPECTGKKVLLAAGAIASVGILAGIVGGFLAAAAPVATVVGPITIMVLPSAGSVAMAGAGAIGGAFMTGMGLGALWSDFRNSCISKK